MRIGGSLGEVHIDLLLTCRVLRGMDIVVVVVIGRLDVG